MDKKKQRARKLQAKMEKAGDTEQDAQQIVMQAEGFGLAKTRDVDDPFEAVDALMSVREDEKDFPDILSAPILRDSTNNGKYRIDEQQFSLLFLEVFQQDNGKGELIPRYSMVGGMLGIPPSTLRQWWGKRDFISAQSTAVVEKGLGYVGTAFMVELIRMIQALGKIDYSKYLEDSKDFKNFISLFNTVSNKVRLFNNRSTQNVEHNHHGGVEMVVPEK